jgi:hypothetical protein
MERMRHKDFYYGSIGVYCIATTSKNDTETTGIIGLLKEMTPMAYAPLALALQDLALPRSDVRKGKGFFTRLLAAMAVSRQRDAEREIARYVTSSGGKFTDETEREIERRFLSNASHW